MFESVAMTMTTVDTLATTLDLVITVSTGVDMGLHRIVI